MKKGSGELNRWKKVKDCMGNDEISFGPYFSYNLKHAPRRMLYTLSHYKFAAKIIGDGKTILEVGCSEGFGTILLAEFADKVVGVDIDKEAIGEATRNFAGEKIKFQAANFLGTRIGRFDAFVSFDVIEHIYPRNERRFFASICDNLKKQSICIIGTPNKTSHKYASKLTRIGHVNFYDAGRLRDAMAGYFHQVFIFSANDEIVHTGFYPMAHYLIGVGVGKR